MSTHVSDRFTRIKPCLDAIPPISRTETDSALTEERTFRGLTRERAIGYLENLGGEQISEEEIVGDGWRATVSTRVLPVGPSYRLTAVTVTWEGDRQALEPVIYGFRLKAFRAPG